MSKQRHQSTFRSENEKVRGLFILHQKSLSCKINKGPFM